MDRLSDAYTDHVLDGLERVCDLLSQAPPEAWQQLVAAGRALRCTGDDDLNRGVVLAINHQRAALLTYSWQRVQTHVEQHLHTQFAEHPCPAVETLAQADLLPAGQCGDEYTDRLSEVSAVQRALCAAVLAMVLADLLDDQALAALVSPTATVIGAPLV